MTPRELAAARRLRKAIERCQKVFGISFSVEDALITSSMMLEEACSRATDASNPSDQEYTRRLFPAHVREMKERLARIQKAKR